MDINIDCSISTQISRKGSEVLAERVAIQGNEDFNLKNEVIELINWISKFGEEPGGGITRLLYTEEWMNAQKALESLMIESGLEAYYDKVGNLYGKLKGTKLPDETIMTGSHIDTVRNGGKYDGQFGIIAGIIAVTFLKEKYGEPLRNIEIVSLAEEEGSRFPFIFWGSKNIVGTVTKEEVEGLNDINGISFSEAISKAGFGFKDQSDKIREDIKYFIELHIEQGGVLEANNYSIGVVEHIVGQRRFIIDILGQANHAGTTPMSYRKDALHATSQIIWLIMDLAHRYGDPLVATVGKIESFPNSTNVVPSRVVFTLDIRHTCKDILVRFTKDVEDVINKISNNMNLSSNIEMYMDENPVPMNTGLTQIIVEQCNLRGLNFKTMHSGAGHDSQIFAPYIPTGLIFVPSKNGVSHSPLEYTEPNDLMKGIEVLIETLYFLAYKC